MIGNFLALSLLAFVGCATKVVPPVPTPTATVVPTVKPVVTPKPTVAPTATPIAIAEDLQEVIKVINTGKIKKQKYIARPVLSTKDTKKLKGAMLGILVLPTQQLVKATTPVVVDLRSMDSKVKDQGQEGLCTSFAVDAAIEFGRPTEDLSERHLWSLYQVYYTDSAVRAATKNYITTETVWPYARAKAVKPVVGRGTIKTYKMAANLAEVYTALQAKKAVVLSVETNTSWSNPYRGVLSTTGAKQGGHAIKVSGFFDTTKGRYLIIKNSWSASYGDKGYVYMPENYCGKFWCSFHIVTESLVK